MIAYCFASGEIEFVPSPGPVPPGAIAFADNDILLPDLSDEEFVRKVTIRARLAFDGKTILVPGIPEAESQVEAGRALQAWVEWAFKRKHEEA